MKKFLLSIVILLCVSHSSFTQGLTFQFDLSGNQTIRRWVCINCPPPYTTNSIVSDNSNLKINDLKSQEKGIEIKKGLNVYPNPLKEILNVDWYSDDNEYLKSIEVFSVSGVRFFFSKYLPSQKSTSISFLELPAGTYLLKANYSSNKQEIIKVIKQ